MVVVTKAQRMTTRPASAAFAVSVGTAPAICACTPGFFLLLGLRGMGHVPVAIVGTAPPTSTADDTSALNQARDCVAIIVATTVEEAKQHPASAAFGWEVVIFLVNKRSMRSVEESLLPVLHTVVPLVELPYAIVSFVMAPLLLANTAHWSDILSPK